LLYICPVIQETWFIEKGIKDFVYLNGHAYKKLDNLMFRMYFFLRNLDKINVLLEISQKKRSWKNYN
jgi:hypothetical protein